MPDYFSRRKNKKNIARFIKRGIKFPDKNAVYIDSSAEIGEGTSVLPGTIIKDGCTIGKNCIIGPDTVLYKTEIANNCILNNVQSEEARIHDNVTAGPFVHIRPGSVLKQGVYCGNFVEVKNSDIGENTKISHLTYVGDSDVGEKVNFGCGSVTVNYNGKEKHRCTIGKRAFIGCNTNLVAPVKIGDRAYTAAGSTITENVPCDALAVARERQTNKKDWVKIKKPYKSPDDL